MAESFLRLGDVRRRVALSASTIYARMSAGDFTIELGGGRDHTLVRQGGKYLCYYNGEPCEPMQWHKDQIAAIKAAGDWHTVTIELPKRDERK